MDRRKTQISLPLNIPEKQFKEDVKQHWNITFSRQGKISVFGKRIMALVLTQIQENDNKLKPYYQMDVSDVMKAGETGSKSAYEHAKTALDELARQIWSIEDIDNKIYRPKQLINTSALEKKEGFEYGYKNGVITIVLNPALEPYFVQMSHYSRYELNNYMKFKSWYSMRLWEILSAYRDKPKYHVSIDDYRKYMGCEKKYPKVRDLILKTTAEPLEELKGTDLEFKVDSVLAKYHGKGRPPVVGLEFTILKPRPVKTDLEQLKEFSNPNGKHPDHEALVLDLHQKWKVTAACLIKYLPIIKMEKAKEIRRQFEMMESIGSKRKIDNKERYCTSVIKKAADAVLESENNKQKTA